MGWPSRLRENFSGVGAKIEYVPVPVLGNLSVRIVGVQACVQHTSAKEAACIAEDLRGATETNSNSPVRAMFARVEDLSHQV